MIEAKRLVSFCLCILVAFVAPDAAQEKPGLTIQDLEKHTYYFDIKDNKFNGDAVAILRDAISRSQFVLLGEYHHSRRISEFTKALIPELDTSGFRNLGLEVGPVSAEILRELSSDPATTVGNLKALNSKHHVVDGDRTFTPIPFFSNVEDAEFLTEARKRRWNLIGLDQEFSFGYLPLIERMYAGLKPNDRAKLKELYTTVTASIKAFYEADIKREKSLYKSILDSKEVSEFLDTASKNNPKNKKIADAIRFTTDVYYMNDDKVRKYYKANGDRVAYMKKNLGEGFERLGLDLKKDKMLLKMGAVHTGRGFSDLSFFEIGNTLSELAELNGNRSLHVYFASRYSVDDDGREVDALDNKDGYLYRFQGLTQMARRDKWTLIDLRTLRQTVFYGRKFKLDSLVLEVFKNHDFVVIPQMETAPTPNYDTASR